MADEDTTNETPGLDAATKEMLDSLRAAAEALAPNRTAGPAGEDASGGLYASAENDLRRSKGL